MKISRNWLSTYIQTELTPEEMADKLTLLGLEVESVEHIGSSLDNILVGRVAEVRKHPAADRLRICQVNLGNRTAQVVCGAPNVEQGQMVAVADIGANVSSPGGETFTIKKTTLRGETSEGMICSESELGLGKGHDGIMVLNTNADPGTPLAKALQIEQDVIFEIGLTPNRPDAACHIGVARDLAAVLETTIKSPYQTPNEVGAGEVDKRIRITIDEPARCGRYVARMVQNIKVGPSPTWLQSRLRSIGLRPINNVVDCTNFILHEVGQPLHAFDYDKLTGPEIRIGSYTNQRPFTTLDSVPREIPAGTLFINDGSGPVAIAGIMGGERTEVDQSTGTILIESAWFLPSSVRKSSKQLALQTDSSYRFERGVDPNLARKACDRAAMLIAEICEGQVVQGVIDLYPEPAEPFQLTLRMDRLNRLLGTDLRSGQALRILNALEIYSEESNDGKLECTIPTFRPDITREVDLIEEVGRVHDYNRIPAPTTLPFFQPAPLNNRERLHQRIRTIATRLQYKEITTNSLLSEKEESYFSTKSEQIRTLNPVSQEATTLRTTLLSGLLKSVQFNLNRNARRIRFFEMGQTYRRTESGGSWLPEVEERSKLILGLCGKRELANWLHEEKSFTGFDLKSDLESLFLQLGIDPFRSIQKEKSEDGRALLYRYEGTVLATLLDVSEEITKAFDIDDRVYTAEVDLTQLESIEQIHQRTVYQPVARFPSFEYDVSYIVEKDVTSGEMIRIIMEKAGDMMQHLDVFDVYEGDNLGKGKKSIAIRLTFLDSNKTLTVKEVEPIIQKVSKALDVRFGAKLRS